MADTFIITTAGGLPYVDEGQKSAGETANDFLFFLSALRRFAVIDRDLNAPPGTIVEGAVYIIGPSPTGAWATYAARVAIGHGGGWTIITPAEGDRAWILDEDCWLWYDGTGWTAVGNVSVESGIAAAGNNSQANAYQLSREVSIVTAVVAATTTGVKLVAATKGKKMVVHNRDAADTLDVFPASGDKIDGGATDAKTTIAPLKCRTFWAQDGTDWFSMLGA